MKQNDSLMIMDLLDMQTHDCADYYHFKKEQLLKGLEMNLKFIKVSNPFSKAMIFDQLKLQDNPFQREISVYSSHNDRYFPIFRDDEIEMVITIGENVVFKKTGDFKVFHEIYVPLKSQVRIALIKDGSERSAYELRLSEFENQISQLEERVKQNLEDSVWTEYDKAASRIRIFRPELKIKDIIGLSREELGSLIQGLKFKTIGFRYLDAYYLFLRVFEDYHISNSSILKEAKRLDNALLKTKFK